MRSELDLCGSLAAIENHFIEYSIDEEPNSDDEEEGSVSLDEDDPGEVVISSGGSGSDSSTSGLDIDVEYLDRLKIKYITVAIFRDINRFFGSHRLLPATIISHCQSLKIILTMEKKELKCFAFLII